MSVIPITIFFSLLLAGSFVALFAREQRRRRFASAERDSLLPLADETPRLAAAPAYASDHAPGPDDGREPGHAHDHAGGPCGCRTGVRPPCAGCRRPAGARARNSAAPLT